jgi:hypothetical protein
MQSTDQVSVSVEKLFVKVCKGCKNRTARTKKKTAIDAFIFIFILSENTSWIYNSTVLNQKFRIYIF